eukprot:Skav224867  [mRNA]  locus=scaffold1112:60608:68906:+ [translate_table: standard]
MSELQPRVKDVLLTHLQTNTEAWEARKRKESESQGTAPRTTGTPELRSTAAPAAPYLLPGAQGPKCDRSEPVLLSKFGLCSRQLSRDQFERQLSRDKFERALVRALVLMRGAMAEQHEDSGEWQ